MGEHDIRHEDDISRADIEVSLAIPHEKFNDSLKINDIALITLSKHVKFTGISHVYLRGNNRENLIVNNFLIDLKIVSDQYVCQFLKILKIEAM